MGPIQKAKIFERAIVDVEELYYIDVEELYYYSILYLFIIKY